MPDYTRMDIMRMSDEEIKEAIAKEGEYLPEGVLEVMLDELKRRSESAEMPELGLSEDEIEELNAQVDGEEEPEEEEEPLEEPTNEAKEEDAKEDEAEKLKLLSEEIDRQNSENRRILIIASVAAGIVAVGSIVVLLILKMLGKL